MEVDSFTIKINFKLLRLPLNYDLIIIRNKKKYDLPK